MKKFYASFKSVVAAVVLASMTLAASCSYDDTGVKNELEQIKVDLAALTERVAALEKRLAEEVDALTDLIEGKVVVTEITKDAEGNTIINLSNGEKVTVLAGCDCVPTEPCDCDPLQYRVVDGVLEVSADGENWIAVKVAPECVVAEVVVNEDNTVTITLANGEEFTVVKAELIEFNSTRAQAYIKAGETKEISFTVNDAVADINIMNQPLGWKATVEAAVADEEAGEGDENVDPGMGILAAGGTEFVLKVTAPSSEFVATGFAEKEGFVSVHFNTTAGACKVAKLQVNLAEITLDVDKAGNVTITNTLVDTYLYSDPWDPWGNSELISEFNNYYLAVMPLDYYTEDLESIYNASWGEFNVPCAGGWINNIYMNLNERNQPTYYEEGVTESWTVVATVEEIIDYLDYYHYLTYEGESFMVLVIPTDIENNGKLLLDQALVAPFKQLNVNVVENEAERKFNNAYFNVTLRGGLAYNLFPIAVSDIQEYIDMEYYASVEEYFEMMMQQYVAQPQWSSFGFKVSSDVVEPNIALMDLLGYTLDYEPYFAIEPNTEYVMAIFTEQEGKTEYTGEDLKYVYFATADIVEAETPAEYTIEYNDQRTYTNIGVDVTVPENTAVAYTRWYEEEQVELDVLKADLIENGYDRTDFEMGYTFSTSTSADQAAAVRYLGLLIVNADGEYTLVQEKLTSMDVVYNTATLAIDKVEFPGDGTAEVYFSGIDGLEIDYIHFYSSDLANTSTYYKNLTEEELADISYSDNWLYRTASDNSNPVVIPYDVAYDTFVVGNTYKFALGVAFTDGTVSNCAYFEAENALPAGAFTPVRAELDLYFDLYEYNGGDAEYAFWLYDAEGACLEVIYKFGPHTDWDDSFEVNMTKADGTVVEGYTSLQTQQPSDYNCAAGEKYYVVIATLTDGTSIYVQAQLPTTEVNYLGEGATAPGAGGGDDSFTYLGRYYDLDSDASTSGGGYMYKVVAGGVEYSLEMYWAYANEDGALKVGTYNYCYNQPDAMYSGWDGFSIISDSYYYGSTLAVTANGVVTLTLKDVNGNLIGEYVYEGVATFGEGGDEPGTGDEVIVLNSADIYNPSGFGDFYVNLYGADLEFVLNFYNCAGAEENFIKAGTYQVSTGNGVVYPGSYSRIWFGEGDDDYYVIDSGSVTVSEVDGQYKFDINVGTSNGLTFVATYTGAVEGLVVPSAYVEPEVGEPQELIIQKHSTSYTGTNEHEIQFWYDYDNYLMVTIDFEANPITAGTYTLEDGLIGQYCNSHNQKMKECTVVVTDNGDGTLTFDASFVVGYDAYYFTYTAQIYSE